MTNRNQIWTRANSLNESRCISLLQLIFPSLSYKFLQTEEGLVRTPISSKREALERIRQGLRKITEVDAGYYISLLDAKSKSSKIKY